MEAPPETEVNSVLESRSHHQHGTVSAPRAPANALVTKYDCLIIKFPGAAVVENDGPSFRK
jgi:hypothetical protein